MSNKDFENKVLTALWTITSDVSELKTKVDTLDKKVDTLDKKVDTLDKKVSSIEDYMYEQTKEINETIENQWKYINQAFEIITNIQNESLLKKTGFKDEKYSYA